MGLYPMCRHGAYFRWFLLFLQKTVDFLVFFLTYCGAIWFKYYRKGVIWSIMVNNEVENQVMLVGSFTHQLDAKRRIIFPSVWRNLAGSEQQLYAFPHPERPCLYLYLRDEMLRRMERLRSVNTLDGEDQQAVRSIVAGGELLHWDVQGRVRIGDHLLRAIEAQSQVVLVGALSRIEVWSVERFDLALPGSSAVADELFFGGY